MQKKTVNEIKMHTFLVCACKSQDFAQSQKFVARSHDPETVTFGNSVIWISLKCTLSGTVAMPTRSAKPLRLVNFLPNLTLREFAMLFCRYLRTQGIFW